MKVDFKVEGNELILKKKLSKNETYKVNNMKGMYQLAIYDTPEWVNGITSMCEDDLHILMIDYDNVCKWIMEHDLNRLINLGSSAFIILFTKEEEINGETIGNYQAICLDKMLPSEVVEKQRMTHGDKSYFSMPLRKPFRSWTLRTSGKGKRNGPKFLGIIGKDKNLDNETSSAHYQWLVKQYRIPKIEYKSPDGLTKLYKNVYETLNRLE